MIILCLDDTAPTTREDVSWATWVGNGRNRWYDKHQRASLLPFLFPYPPPDANTVIVYENGRSGFLGEHSCMDGTPTLRMNEFVLGSLASRRDLGAPMSKSTGTCPFPPT